MNFRHLHLKSCESTQQQLAQFLETSHQDCLISTDYQSKGRGTHQRAWDFYPGSLAMSFTLTPHPIKSLTSLELGVLVARYFKTQKLQLKWPNDLLNRQHKKVGGFLIEEHNKTLICGLGLNIGSQTISKSSYRTAADSLDLSLPIEQLAKELYTYILNHRLSSKDQVITSWLELCAHLNQPVSIQEAQSKSAIFIGIGDLGQALLHTEHGQQEVYSGTLILDQE